MPNKRKREHYLAIIKLYVAALVKADRYQALKHVLEGSGYLNNLTQNTSKGLGDAIIALAHVIPLRWARSTALQAVFEYTFDREHLPDDEVERRERCGRANRLSDHVVRRSSQGAIISTEIS